MSGEVEGMKVDVTKMNYPQLEEFAKGFPFEILNVSRYGSRVLLEAATA